MKEKRWCKMENIHRKEEKEYMKRRLGKKPQKYGGYISYIKSGKKGYFYRILDVKNITKNGFIIHSLWLFTDVLLPTKKYILFNARVEKKRLESHNIEYSLIPTIIKGITDRPTWLY
jgi:hypothetical protein